MLILHNKAKQIFIPLLKILVAILSMAFIIQKAISQEEYYDVLLNLIFKHSVLVQIFFLVLCIGFSTFNWVLEIFKWKVLSSQIYPTSFKKSSFQTLSAHAVAILTPNRIGDYGAKMLFFPKRYSKRVLGLNFWNNFSQMAITVLLGSIGILFLIKNNSLFGIFNLHYPLLVVFFLSTCFVCVLLKKKLKKLWLTYQPNFEIRKAIQTKIYVLSFMRYLVFSYQFIFISWFFGWDLAYLTALPILCVVYILASIVPSVFIVDAAIKTSIAIYLYGLVEVPSSIILATSIVMWILNFALPAFIGSIWIMPNMFNNPKVAFKMKVN